MSSTTCILFAGLLEFTNTDFDRSHIIDVEICLVLSIFKNGKYISVRYY